MKIGETIYYLDIWKGTPRGAYRRRRTAAGLFLERWTDGKWVIFPQLADVSGQGGADVTYELATAAEVEAFINKPVKEGGAGSGHWGHEGVEGQLGGSAPSGGGHGQHATSRNVDSFRAKFKAAPEEHLTIYGKDGNPIIEAVGDKYGVELSADEFNRVRGADTMIHNHPFGEPQFSDDDIQFMMDSDINTSIIIAGDTVSTLQRTPDSIKIGSTSLAQADVEVEYDYYEQVKAAGGDIVSGEQRDAIWNNLRTQRVEELALRNNWRFTVEKK